MNLNLISITKVTWLKKGKILKSQKIQTLNMSKDFLVNNFNHQTMKLIFNF